MQMQNVAIQDCQKVICLRNEVVIWGLVLFVFKFFSFLHLLVAFVSRYTVNILILNLQALSI